MTFQACPAPSWTTTAPTMDFTYDVGAYNNSFAHSGYYNNTITATNNNNNMNSSFPSSTGLSQTLCELDIDNNMIHKLFEGLPEIFEDGPTHSRDVVDAQAVTVASSQLFPSTPPAQASSRPSNNYSMCGSGGGGVPQGLINPLHEVAPRVAPLARNVNTATSYEQPVLIRPKGGVCQEVQAPADHHRKVGRARKGKGGPGKVGESKVVAGKSKVLEAKPIPASQAVSAVACMVPKMILPATAVGVPAVDLSSSVKVSEQQHVAHLPLHLGLGPGAPAVCFRAPKRSRNCRDATTTQMANTRTQKTRYFDKVEHIVRERWRRDDMAGKFLALESLLPPSSKRDRSTIVEDSMKLVKSLQHRKEEALKRRAELKQAATTTQSPGVKLSRIIQKIGSLAVIPHLHHGSNNNNLQLQPAAHAFSAGPPSSSSMVLSTTGTKRPLDVVDDSSVPTVVPKLLSDCVHRFYVQSELSTGDIVIEMICEQIPNFHSALLKSMESLGLEVLRCSVTMTINKLICNITVKPFPSSASVNSSSTSIMEGLSSAFRKV